MWAKLSEQIWRQLLRALTFVHESHWKAAAKHPYVTKVEFFDHKKHKQENISKISPHSDICRITSIHCNGSRKSKCSFDRLAIICKPDYNACAHLYRNCQPKGIYEQQLWSAAKKCGDYLPQTSRGENWKHLRSCCASLLSCGDPSHPKFSFWTSERSVSVGSARQDGHYAANKRLVLAAWWWSTVRETRSILHFSHLLE